MSVTVTCPGCRTSYPVTEDLLGKKIRCKKCQETFTATAAKTAAAAGRAADERIQTRPGAKAAAANGNGDDGANGNGRTKPARKPQPAAGNNKAAVLICTVAGALVVGMGLVTLWALNRPPATPEGSDVTQVNPAPPPRVTPPPSIIDDTAGQEKTGGDTAKTGTDVAKTGADTGKTGSAAATVPTLRTEDVYSLMPKSQPRPADFRPGVIDKAKKAAVWIKCTSEDQMGTGSGWVAEQDGQWRYIVTNAHVLFMDKPNKPAPEKIEVIFHAGTPEERPLEAKLLALDREEDLAVISVKGPDLPEPLTIAPSSTLHESERLITLGFPMPDRLQTLGLIQVRARPTSITSRVPNKDGSIKLIQIEGGVDPGNSGGATIDTNGHVVAVVVSQFTGTNMKFVIPSEYVVHLLHGRVQRVIPSQAVASGGTIRQPLQVHIADPMQRISGVSADVWAGKVVGGQKIRPASDRAPTPQQGDGQRVKVALSYNPERTMRLGDSHTAGGVANLTPLKDGEVYWFQPRYVGKDGKERWGEAIVIEMARHPVQARPATLELKHEPDVKADQKRTAVLDSRQQLTLDLEGVGNMGRDSRLTATLTERTQRVESNGDARVRLQYVDLGLSDKDQDSAFRRELRGVLESAKRMGVEVTVTRDGRYRSPVVDKADVPVAARPVLTQFNQQIMSALEAMALNLPNREVQPGDTWSQDTTHTITYNQRVENAVLRMTCRYAGTRTRNGRTEAVIELSGQVVRGGGQRGGRGGDEGPGGGQPRGGGDDNPGGGQPPRGGAPGGGEGNRQRGITGDAAGGACVDLQTGQVTLARVESDLAIDSEIAVRGPNPNQPARQRVVYGMYLDVKLRRSLTNVAPKEVTDQDLAEFLPHQVRVYNPLVGVASAATAELAPASPSAVPERATLMTQDAAEKVKKAAVMIRVERADGGGEGSGFFAEPGLVVTNCHVVGMLQKTDRMPEKIEVFLDLGTDRERKLPGQLLTIDREDDLAVIRVVGENLPEPLRILPATTLNVGQRLQVIGFPRGSSKVKTIEAGTGARGLLTTLSARLTTVAGPVPKEDRSLKYMQLEGGADHGNSGGAIVDADGHVRLVLVAGLTGTEMRFGIPGEYAARLLQGYPLEVSPGRAWLDGSVAKQPIEVKFADPLKRVTRIALDYWVGAPGKPRMPSEKAPKPEPGDDLKRNTVELKYTPEKKTEAGWSVAAADFVLPEVAPGRVLWIQPRFTNGTGQEQWGQAVSHAPDPPVQRIPVRLAIQHRSGTERTMELSSLATFRWHLYDERNEMGFPLKATLVERTLTTPRDGSATVQLQYTDLVLDLPTVLGGIEIPSEIRNLLRMFTSQIKSVLTVVNVTREGVIRKHQADYSALPIQARVIMAMFNDQIIKSLSALCIPLPDKQVNYGHTWEHPTNLFIETRNRYEAALFTMKFKYVGVRERGGRQEAVIEIEGSLTKDPNEKSIDVKDLKDKAATPPSGESVPPGTGLRQPAPRPRDGMAKKGLYGQARGYALVDVAGGYVSEVKLYIDMDVELTVKDKDTKADVQVMAGAVMELLLKRLTSATR